VLVVETLAQDVGVGHHHSGVRGGSATPFVATSRS
jgi:hypothetical protein